MGVVLGGGRGTRMGGGKLAVALAGRPLISYPLEAMRGVVEEVAVIAKPDTVLPPLPGVTIWTEPPEPHHPLLGVAVALSLAGGRPVLVCAGDMPFVTGGLLRRLLAASAGGASAVAVSDDGGLQPLLGCYHPPAAEALLRAARAGSPARAAVWTLGPQLVEVPDRRQRELFNVNTPEDLLQATALLDGLAAGGGAAGGPSGGPAGGRRGRGR